jgi:hypothetical protein
LQLLTDQSYPEEGVIRVLEKRLTLMIVLLPYVQNKQWLLVDEQIDQTAQHSRSIIDPLVGALAEEVRKTARFGHQLLQLVYNTAEQHCLAFTGVAFDSEKPTLVGVAPLSEVGVFDDPHIRVL